MTSCMMVESACNCSDSSISSNRNAPMEELQAFLASENAPESAAENSPPQALSSYQDHVPSPKPERRWRGLLREPKRRQQLADWGMLVGGMNWGRCSPSVLSPHQPTWQQHLGPPTTMHLFAEEHALRACRRTTACCATIRRSPNDAQAQLLFHGGGGMVRVNDRWVEEEGECVEIVAGDAIELVCLEHPTIRHHGWYTACCAERRGGNLVSQTWRFVPTDDSFRMLSPSEEVKSFFPQMSPPVVDCGCEDALEPSSSKRISSSQRKRRKEYSVVHLRLRGYEPRHPSTLPVEQRSPLPMPDDW